MKYDTKRMFCVETNHRYPGDLGASIIVLAEDVLDALAEVRRCYPEYTELKPRVDASSRSSMSTMIGSSDRPLSRSVAFGSA